MKSASNHVTKRVKITLTDGSVIDGVRHEHDENVYYSDMKGNVISTDDISDTDET